MENNALETTKMKIGWFYSEEALVNMDEMPPDVIQQKSWDHFWYTYFQTSELLPVLTSNGKELHSSPAKNQKNETPGVVYKFAFAMLFSICPWDGISSLSNLTWEFTYVKNS